MAFHPTQSNVPLSQTDAIAANLKIHLEPQPPLVNEAKWNRFSRAWAYRASLASFKRIHSQS